MSVELILYPQENPLDEFVVDGLTFATINNSTNTDSTNTTNIFDAIFTATPPTLAGAWYRFRMTAVATPAQASESSGVLTLNAVTGATFCGVYQKLSGLIAGQNYTITIDTVSTTGFIIFGHRSATGGSQFNSFTSAGVTQATYTFTALSASDTIFIAYSANSNSDLDISKISVTGEVTLKEWEGQVICDLYEHEEIPLTLSVDNFKNAAEKIQSYSKDFNLPATKRNNQIFGNLFEITRTVANPYDFNPYAKTRSVLKQNGFILFDGFIRLIDIQDRDGEISYNVNLYAQTTALADTLKNRTFDFIDFSELEHTYSKVAIKGSWYTDGLPLTNALPPGTYAGTAGTSVTDVLKYPFVDWSGQILIANGATGNNSTAGRPEITSLEQAFRPFIKIKYLIDRIFSEAGYTYSSTLFDSTSFGKLFMDFNWGGSDMPTVIPDETTTATYPKYQSAGVPPVRETTTAFITAALIDQSQTGGDANSNTPADYQNTTSPVAADIYKIVNTSDNRLYQIDYTFFLKNNSSDPNTEGTLRWAHYDAVTTNTTIYDSQTKSIGANISEAFQGNISILLNDGDKLYPEFAGTGGATFSIKQRQQTVPNATVTFNINSTVVNSAVLNSNRGEINQWDFLKGIFTMFNLVTLQDKTDPANIIIKPYSDVFIKTGQGTTLKERNINHDWTDKVDLKDITLTPLNDLKKKTVFKYEQDDDDYIFNLYRRSTRGHLYGSKVFSAEGLTLLEGEDEIVASPFAATVSKPLGNQFTNLIVPTIYSKNDDGTNSSFDNLPRILYNTTGASPIDIAPASYYIPEQNGENSENSELFFTFSHLTDIPTIVSTPPVSTDTFDYNFGECQYIQPLGQTTTLNLFNTYWFPYYNELYDPDTKTMKLKVNLQPGDIATFNFSDYVMIKNRSYRVNRIDYKPKDLSTVEFILIS